MSNYRQSLSFWSYALLSHTILSPRRVSPSSRGVIFHLRSRFACSTIPEGKWGLNSRSLVNDVPRHLLRQIIFISNNGCCLLFNKYFLYIAFRKLGVLLRWLFFYDRTTQHFPWNFEVQGLSLDIIGWLFPICCLVTLSYFLRLVALIKTNKQKCEMQHKKKLNRLVISDS